MAKNEFALSPSLYHRWLMDQTKPELRFTGGDVKVWQRKLRRKLRQLLGLNETERRLPLNVRSLWKQQNTLGSIEKIVFCSEPHADVPAYLCLPKGAKPPYRFFICVQGHTTGMHISIAADRKDESLPIQVSGDRDFALSAMKNNFAALCIEQRSFGERREQVQKVVSENGCHDATMQALALGKTLIGERVYDVDRAIDYLALRGDVDMKRIGVMGNSGGGTTALFSAALLSRVACAMPSCYFCTFRDSIMSIDHCMDNYIPGILKYAEMDDIMGLFAPKPVVIVAGRKDDIFPFKATRKVFSGLKKIYAAAGSPDTCKLVVGPEGHRFYADIAWAAMKKLMPSNRFLK